MATPLIATYRTWHGRAAVANSNLDGTGTIVDVATAHPTYGSRIDVVRAHAEVVTTDGLLRLFLHNGSAWRLLMEIAVPAVTASGTVAAWDSADIYFRGGGLHLPAGWRLGAAVANAEPVNVFATGGDYGAA